MALVIPESEGMAQSGMIYTAVFVILDLAP
jgi:hypothetical protein